MPAWPHITLIIAAYLIGGLSPGYWLAKRVSGVDLRATGSGATGATNAGRLLGKRGYFTVALLDLLKGALVALFARYAWPAIWPDVPLPLPWQFAASFAVVVGHIWPIWLGFRGGKGVATFYGAWSSLLDWQGFIPVIICFALCLILKYVFRRSFKSSWLATVALFPVIIWWLARNNPETAADAISIALITAATILVIWIAHRENIAAIFRRQKY